MADFWESVKNIALWVWEFDQVRFTIDALVKLGITTMLSGFIGFERVPVDGSTKMDDALMESIEPYDLKDAVEFSTAYLSGYFADRYDVDSESSRKSNYC